ncbi:MAG: GatB/YqeY domain-containing protein [Saprospirales bacterium]|nr:MAG: GatB/YqeY domain-containing protein [Saprospirales bacterium]
MSLKEEINGGIKQAMKDKNQAALRALRSVKSAILLAETDGSGKEVDDSAVIRIIQKLSKQRKDSLDLYIEQNRPDLAEKEREELEILERYLPKAMGENELKAFLTELVRELGASGMQDMGRTMGAAQQRLAGRADGKAISAIVRQLLN